MRYLLGILALFFIVSCKSVPSVSDSPLHKKMLKSYPERIFISIVGMGDSLEAARNDGVFQISAYLKAEIQSDLQADTRELFIDSDEVTYSSTVDYVVTDITISSDIELPTLEFSEPYVDGETGTWMVCAYINREKALNKLKPEILELESEFNTSLSLAENETEPFVKICSYKKALATAKKLTEKIIYANLFSSAETDRKTPGKPEQVPVPPRSMAAQYCLFQNMYSLYQSSAGSQRESYTQAWFPIRETRKYDLFPLLLSSQQSTLRMS